MLAWFLYVNECPTTFNVSDSEPEPGEMPFTRFPLSAFIKTCESYIVNAETLIETDRVPQAASFLGSLRTPVLA